MSYGDSEGTNWTGIIMTAIIGFTLFFIIALYMFIVPQWRVWQQKLEGEAVFAKSEQARKVLVSQAQAEKDAAVLRSEAIKIVGQAAKDFPEYRTQEFIGAFAHALESGKISQIIYVPTEANIPIVEAGKRY